MGKPFHTSFASRVALSTLVIGFCIGTSTYADTTISYPLRPMQIYVNQVLTFHPDGLYAIDPNSEKNTTFMPIWYVMQSLKRLGIRSTWNGSVWDLQLPQHMISPIQSQLVLNPGSGPVAIEVDGHLQRRTPSIVTKDPEASNTTTFVPIWYVGSILEHCGINVSWNGTTWALNYPAIFIAPSSNQTSSTTPSSGVTSTLTNGISTLAPTNTLTNTLSNVTSALHNG
ncbi:MAG: hypothetical protein OWR52_04505 [Acidibacillus sp.]|nr:hypothetical protein [Acidibacillus sp.]